jgi:hypothetical protein
MLKNLVTLVLAFSLTMTVFSSPSSYAANSDAKENEAATNVSKAAVVYSLIQEGRKLQSPIILAAAAEILNSTALKETKLKKTTEGGEELSPPPSDDLDSFIIFDVKSLYDEAIKLAEDGGNENLTQVFITLSAQKGTRQSTNSAIEHKDRLKPRSTDVYSHSFKANDKAAVLILAENAVSIELAIYDSKGDLVIRNAENTNVGLCEWVPGETQTYTIKVLNYTDLWSDYYLISN